MIKRLALVFAFLGLLPAVLAGPFLQHRRLAFGVEEGGTDHRYWRIYYDGTLSQFWQVRYIKWDTTTDLSGSQLADDTNLTASSEFSGRVFINTVDDLSSDNGDTWMTATSSEANPWISIDLGDGNDADIQSVKFKTSGNGRHVATALLQYSDNGSDWTTKATLTTGTSNNFEYDNTDIAYP